MNALELLSIKECFIIFSQRVILNFKPSTNKPPLAPPIPENTPIRALQLNPRSDLISAVTKLWHYFKLGDFTLYTLLNDNDLIDLRFLTNKSVVFYYKILYFQ